MQFFDKLEHLSAPLDALIGGLIKSESAPLLNSSTDVTAYLKALTTSSSAAVSPDKGAKPSGDAKSGSINSVPAMLQTLAGRVDMARAVSLRSPPKTAQVRLHYTLNTNAPHVCICFCAPGFSCALTRT